MSLTIYKRGNTWHYRGTVAGRRLRGSTDTSDENRARRIAAETEAKAWSNKLDGPEATFTFANACQIYLDAGRSAREVRYVADIWKDTLVKDIRTPAVHAAAWKKYPNTTGASRNRFVVIPTQGIINFSAKQGFCPPLRVEKFKTVRNEKQPVTLTWIQQFTATADPQLAALAWFMFLTGARISEALAVEWTDIEGSTVTIMMGKRGGLTRRAHMPDMLQAALSKLSTSGRTIFDYRYTQRAARPWRRQCVAAGVKFLSFHSCRHGFATSLLHAGIDPITIAKLGGWASAQHVFSTYGHAMQDRTVTDRLLDTTLTQRMLTQEEKPKEIEHLGTET
jgi:integrase